MPARPPATVWEQGWQISITFCQAVSSKLCVGNGKQGKQSTFAGPPLLEGLHEDSQPHPEEAHCDRDEDARDLQARASPSPACPAAK